MQKILIENDYNSGFTLIELLVVMGIMGLMFGLGSMYFSQIVNNQQGKKSISQTYQGLYKARQYALLGKKDKCNSDDVLLGIKFMANNGSNEFKIQANCSGSYLDIETITLENTASFNTNVDIVFNTPQGNIDPSSSFIVTIADKSRTFTVNSLGTITVN